ncbi:MAG: redoxin domain-containing protein [Myxococcales bacterium]|nr:MAG: redoxin domain-containing protein [Myxococcales bacterium]
MRDAHGELEKAGVTVLGVSFDDPSTNAQFVEAEGFPFALLSDSDHALAVSVGAATDRSQDYARRISYLVDADGPVIAAYAVVDPATHARQVLEDLAAGSD